VGSRAFRTIETIPQAFINDRRLTFHKKRRPSRLGVEMVLRVVAQNMPEHSNSRLFGDCDETHSQIAARLHSLVSIERVAAALRVLDNHIFLVTRKAAKGRNGTHRTFHPELAYNIAKWERSGAEPTPQEVAVWDERLYGLGYKPQHSGVEAQRSGVSPAPPIEVPIASTYKTPNNHEVIKGSGALKRITESTSMKMTHEHRERLREISNQTWRRRKSS